MKTKISSIAALTLVAIVGTSAIAAPALAQERSSEMGKRDQHMGPRHDGGQMQARGSVRGGFPLLALTCAPEAAERYETVLNAVGDRLELTEDQTVAFEDLRTTALAAQTGFSDTCAAFATVEDDDAAEPDLIDRLTQRQVMLSAQVEAMDNVLPALETFYDSLTDEQKDSLLPQRGDGDNRGMRGERPAPRN